jgi:hypothetical protein
MSLTCGFAGLPQRVARETAGQSKVVCVRGASRPLRTCLRSQVSWFSGSSGDQAGGPVHEVTPTGCVALLALLDGTVFPHKRSATWPCTLILLASSRAGRRRTH